MPLASDTHPTRSVLIVDDHPRFLATLRRMLESEGWRVAGEAVDGGEALRKAPDLCPDVVLLDVGLPDISGLEVAQRLHTALPDAAVVLMSTRDADYRVLAGSHGACGFIAKSELSGTTLRELLSRSR